MSWSDQINRIKTWVDTYQRQRAFEAALKRDRVRNQRFWKTIGEHLGPSHRTYVSDTLVDVFQNFLSTLEVPLKNNPDSALFGAPLLQLYFGYSGMVHLKVGEQWNAEHKILALALNAGLPVTPALSQMFVEFCETQSEFLNFSIGQQPVDKSDFFDLPKRRPGHSYPTVRHLPQVWMRNLLSPGTLARPIGEQSNKIIAGAQLLEVFGANWNQVSSSKKTLGTRLFEQLGQPQEFEHYSSPPVEVNVDQIIAQKKQDNTVEFSKKPKLKI